MSIHQPTRNQSRKFNNSDPEPNPGTEPGFSTEEEDDDDDDDDFDDGEDNNTDASYVETNVLLGYVEEEGKGDGDKNGDGSGNGNGDDRDEDGDGSISFLGGWPIWLSDKDRNDNNNDNNSDDNSNNITSPSANNSTPTPPSPHLISCSACGNLMSLLLQLNANLPDRFPGHERRLYVFSCRRKACQRKKGCVGVVRGVRVDSEGVGSGEVSTRHGDGIVDDDDGEDGSRTAKKEQEVSSTKQLRLGDAIFGVPAGSNNGSGTTESRNPFSLNSKGQSGTTGGGNPFSTKAATSTSTSVPSSRPDISTADKPKSSNQDTADLPERFRSALRVADDTSSAGPTTPTAKPKDSNPSSSTTTQENAAQSKTKANTQPHEPWPPRSAFPTPYPKYPLEADYETLDRTAEIPKTLEIPSDEDAMQIDESANANTDVNEKPIFESTLDRTFQRFADRLAQNPEQVLRYEFKGKPLLYASGFGNGDGDDGDDEVVRAFEKGSVTAMRESKRPKVSVNDNSTTIDSVISGTGTDTGTGTGKETSLSPPCPNCNAPRVFEVQLTPHAIEVLEDDDEAAGTGTGSSLDGMSWGTIIVAVCLADCRPAGVKVGQVGYLKEWVGVQWEEVLEEAKK